MFFIIDKVTLLISNNNHTEFELLPSEPLELSLPSSSIDVDTISENKVSTD